jgi:hypothetical protein
VHQTLPSYDLSRSDTVPNPATASRVAAKSPYATVGQPQTSRDFSEQSAPADAVAGTPVQTPVAQHPGPNTPETDSGMRQVGQQETTASGRGGAMPDAKDQAAGLGPQARPRPDLGPGIQEIDRDAIGPEASFHNRDVASARKSYVDLTVQPWFSHAEDYSSLSGQITYSRSTKTWRLHYASVDTTDPYGGTVTLMDSDKLKGLQDGQCIRVEGHLVNPDRKELDAPYNVGAVKVIDKEP